MTEVDELRPPTAWRLLEIWRGTRELAEEPLERALLCNAQVLAESCLYQGAPVFDDGAAVLARLTAGEMEEIAALDKNTRYYTSTPEMLKKYAEIAPDVDGQK